MREPQSSMCALPLSHDDSAEAIAGGGDDSEEAIPGGGGDVADGGGGGDATGGGGGGDTESITGSFVAVTTRSFR